MNARTPRPVPVLTCLALSLPALGPAPGLAEPARGRAPEATWIGQELRLPQPTPALETAQAEPAPGETAPASPSAPLWSGTVELYGFAPLRSTGSVTIRGQEAEVDQDLGEILDVLRFAASARASIEKGRVGLQGDLWYINLGDQASRLVGPRSLFTTTADVGQTLGIYDLALRYRFGERESAIGKPGTYSVIPYAGIRLIDGRLSLAATLDGPFGRTLLEPSRSLQRTWVQPLVGTQASVFLSPRLRAFARGDIGGFGLAGQQDLSGNAQVGLGYAIGDNTDLNISWRYMGLKWNNGDTQPNGFVTNLNGIEIGVKFFFGGAPRGPAVATTPATQATPIVP